MPVTCTLDQVITFCSITLRFSFGEGSCISTPKNLDQAYGLKQTLRANTHRVLPEVYVGPERPVVEKLGAPKVVPQRRFGRDNGTLHQLPHG